MSATTVNHFRLIAEKLIGFDYINLSFCIYYNPKTSKLEKAVNLSKICFSLPKRQMHIFIMSARAVQSFELIA